MYSFNEMVVPLPRPPQEMIFLISTVFTNCNIYVVLFLTCIKKYAGLWNDQFLQPLGEP